MVIVVVVIISLPTFLFILIQNSKVQTFLIRTITNYVSDNYNTKIQVERVNFAFFNQLILEGVYVEDNWQDTLAYIDKLKVNIRKFSYKNNHIFLKKIELQNPVIKLYTDSLKHSNLQNWLDNFASNSKVKEEEEYDPDAVSWNVEYDRIKLQNLRFVYHEYYHDTVDFGMNFSDLEIDSFNLNLSKFTLGDTISFRLHHLSLKDKSGFRLTDFYGDVAFCDRFSHIDSLHLIMGQTALHADYMYFDYDSLADFSDFTDRILMNMVFLDSTKINTDDIAYFVSDLKSMKQTIKLSGNIKGKVTDLEADSLKIRIGKKTMLKINLAAENLTNFDLANMNLRIDTFQTYISDIDAILRSPMFDDIELPAEVRQLYRVAYHGSFTKLSQSMTADGLLKTGLGNIYMDMTVTPDTIFKLTHIQGVVSSKLFNVGAIIGDTLLNAVSFNDTLDLIIYSDTTYSGFLKGSVGNFAYNNYYYQNVLIDAAINEKQIIGSVRLKDPYANVMLSGTFDYSQKVPYIDANLTVTDLHFDKLNLDNVHSPSILNMEMSANLQGGDLNSLIGHFDIPFFEYQYEDEVLKVERFEVSILEQKLSKKIEILSDFCDIVLDGRINLGDLPLAFTDLASIYMPAYVDKPPIDSSTFLHSNFKIDVLFGNPQKLFQVFMPELFIHPQTKLNGHYNSEFQSFELDLETPKLAFADYKIAEFSLRTKTDDELFKIESSADTLFFGSFAMETFGFNAQIEQDSLDFLIAWNDWNEENPFWGNISAAIQFISQPNKTSPIIKIQTKSSEVMFNHQSIVLEPTKIIMDSTAFDIFNLSLSMGTQKINFEGKISENPNDSLYVLFCNLQLANFNKLLEESGFNFGGILNGDAQVANLYQNPMINSYIKIDSFKINQKVIGHVHFNTDWDNELETLNLQLLAKKTSDENFNTIDAQGIYFPKDKQMDFKLNFKGLPLEILNPMLEDVLTFYRGYIDGNLIAQGTVNEPIIRGGVGFRSTKFKVDYLKTLYSIEQKDKTKSIPTIKITDKDITFDNFMIEADSKSEAELKGKIFHRYFSDFKLDFGVEMRNFNVLNTTPKDNETFYGTAYITGLIGLKGTLDDMEIDVNAITRKNTNLNIPLTSSSEASTSNFVTFVNQDSTQIEVEDNYEVDISGMQIYCKLEVTPDAKIRLIFDETVGDEITAAGEGEMFLSIDKESNIELSGEYIIKKGEYLFTLKNVINKKFIIEKGSSISWAGDPYNAILDLTAIYALKNVSLYDLLLDNEVKETKMNVDCELSMKKNLTDPIIEMGIGFPGSKQNDRIKNQVSTLSDEDLNKQILSLLILNRFQPLPGLTSDIQSAETGGGVNADELLSNQLSHWLSQISSDVDVGINYRRGDEISEQEVEVALSTTIWNDRIIINTNVGMQGEDDPTARTETNSIMGDVDVELKLTQSGKLRLKMFRHSNDNEIDPEAALYTNGIGIFYKEEFNSLNQLYRRYNKSLKESREKLKNKENIPINQDIERRE